MELFSWRFMIEVQVAPTLSRSLFVCCLDTLLVQEVS
jgi:hypothetical protein